MKDIKGFLYDIDKKLFDFFNNFIKCRFLDIIMPLVTKLGSASISICIPLIMVIFGDENIKKLGIECLTAITSSHLLVQILKRMISRERPYNIFKNINTFGMTLKDSSWPSGHTTASFSLATTISMNLPYIGVMVIGLALIVGISRIYLAVHYPSDVLSGLLIGSVFSMFLHGYYFF
ncbi:phosphatase PAP2 family protein [Clostridiisalibacter paucivorans]|uniref:phosphatase PAP2 family protein n=1 Tax=Clostridiisalibacter paucivorans TaxID=408753 RepID=UPI00047BA705|nr:phosphatase PAP2 family protein [Clostridiisalibacter paucivorans]